MTPDELRRLLELAANAIGGTLSEGDTKVRTGPTWDTWEWGGQMGINTAGSVTIHPQHDDGDSRRLQVKLGINHRQYSNIVNIRGCWAHDGYVEATKKDIQEREPINGNPCAATRLAVLRAAASIGEAMP